jgi:carboxymethylenebutenolidase
MEPQKVSFPSANSLGDASGVVIGDLSNNQRGLIVIHEWWGMNQTIMDVGRKISDEGKLVVLVIDMYRGKVAIDREHAGHLMHDLDWEGAVQDLSAGAKYLKSNGCTKVGVTGFCLGGALSFAAAVACPEIDAAVPFYGIPRSEAFDLTKIRIPVQGHFGEKDNIVGFSTPSDYEPLNAKLLKAGVPYVMHTYPVGHAFVNPSGPYYDAEATKLALSRMYEFLQKNL